MKKDTLKWTKIEAPNAPSPRVAHRMVAIGNQLVVFGGGVWSYAAGWEHVYNDTYIFHTGSFARI